MRMSTTARVQLKLIVLPVALATIALSASVGGDSRAGTRKPQSARTSGARDLSVFAYSRARPLGATTKEVNGTKTLRVFEVSYSAADGERVPATLALPRRSSRRHPCLIGQGGIGFTRKDASFFRAVFGSAGFGLFSIEPRYHGGRRTSTIDSNVAANDARLLERMLRLSVIDLRRGIDYLQQRPECDPKRIGYVGLSFGSFLGSMLVGADERVRAAALIVSGADWPVFFAGSDALLPGIEHRPERYRYALELLAPIDPKRWIGRASPRPLLMINGTRDLAIPTASAQALHEAARRPKQVVWYEGDHEGTFGGNDGERLYTTFYDFVLRNVGGRG